jgi:hypothetical protein
LKALKKYDRKWILELGKGDAATHEGHQPIFDGVFCGFRAEHKEYVASFKDDLTVSNREIERRFRQQFPDFYFQSGRHIKLLRHRLRQKDAAGYTPIQDLIRQLDEKEVNYTVKWKNGIANGMPVGLFWTTLWPEKMWKLYHKVQMYDNTYKTNKTGWAFFQICTKNHFNQAVSCAFGLIDNERQEGFDWLASQILITSQRLGIPPPGVTITDFDAAMKNALGAAFPQAKPQICIFHLNKNIALNLKRKWKREAVPAGCEPRTEAEELTADEEGIVQRLNHEAFELETTPICGRYRSLPSEIEYSKAGCYELWAHIIYAPYEDLFQDAWTMMQTYFAPKPPFCSTWKRHTCLYAVSGQPVIPTKSSTLAAGPHPLWKVSTTI